MIENDIDLKNWRYYLDEEKLTTDTIWLSSGTKVKGDRKFIIPKRDNLPKNSSKFHGLWIPEIPYQFIQRFTKQNDRVWSVFGGSGTDYRVCQVLNRECVINDIEPVEDYIVEADSRYFDAGEVDLALVHPPYHDIVQYSDKDGDGSTLDSVVDFINWFKEVRDNITKHLKDNGHVVLACGNIYKNSEEIPLGLYLALTFLADDYILKSHIVKDYGETKGSEAKNYNINYYRQLKHGYNNFSFDNIFILKKTKGKNNNDNILQAISS